MRNNPISTLAFRIRDALGRFPGTSWLIGGAEAECSHTLRQGMLASLLIMVGSWGVGWLPMTPGSLLAANPLLLPLRTTTSGAVVCAVLLILGALLLLRSWLRLSQRVGRWDDAATGVMMRALLMWGVPLLATVPIFSRDVFSYLAQGRLLHAGLNPYESGVSQLPGWFMEGADGLWAESPSPYGPLFLVIAQLFWFISGGVPEVAILLFRMVSVIGIALIVYAVPRLARAFGSQPAWALWVSLLNPLSLLVFLPAAHNDSLMIGLMMTGCWLALGKRRLFAVLALVAAIAVKPTAMVVLPFAVLLSLDSTRSYVLRFREWAFGGVIAIGLLVAGGYALGIGLGWVTASLGAGGAIPQTAPVGLLGTGIGMLVAPLTGADVESVAQIVYAAARAAAAILLIFMLLQPRLGNPVLWSAYGLAAVVLSSSIIQPWYLLWVLPLFAVVHVYRGPVLMLVTGIVTAMVLMSTVGQLSVAQWVDTRVVIGSAVSVAVVYLIYIVFFDPNTADLFDVRQRSQRWNSADGWLRLRRLSTPHTSWTSRAGEPAPPRTAAPRSISPTPQPGQEPDCPPERPTA